MLTADPALVGFVAQSNRIEGICRAPTDDEIQATEEFITLDRVTERDLVYLVAVFQADAVLRDEPGLDVRVGSHIPMPGGPGVAHELGLILARSTRGQHPYRVHHAYEILHPFTAGNGSSGRALWLWGMRRRGELDRAFTLGFLHSWYYQSLEHGLG